MTKVTQAERDWAGALEHETGALIAPHQDIVNGEEDSLVRAIIDAHFIRLQQVMREWHELRDFATHMQSDAMVKAIGEAVFDPGKFAGIRSNETMRQWTVRAVLSAIGEHHG